MAKRNRSLSMSSASSITNARETLAIKREKGSDSENSALESVKDEVDHNVVEMKKESGDAQPAGGRTYSKAALQQDFGFIRSCLEVVLLVDSNKRHELVQAMKSKLKLIETITTGKKTSNATIFHVDGPRGSSSNLVKEKSRRQLLNPDVRNREGEFESSQSDEEDFEGSWKMRSEDSHRGEWQFSGDHTEGLVTEMEDGTAKCNVCDRILTNIRRICAACSSYVSRMRVKSKATGKSLPMCRHKDFSAGAFCKSCRFRKYIRLSKGMPHSPPRDELPPARSSFRPKKGIPVSWMKRGRKQGQGPHKQKCFICEKFTPWFKSWRCSACFIFHKRLIARHSAGEELPECDHGGSFAGVGCKGCRRLRLQREAALREPKLASMLPELPPQNGARTQSRADASEVNISDFSDERYSSIGDDSD